MRILRIVFFYCPGEQRAAERSGAPAHQAQNQTAGPREQGFLSGQAFHIYLFTLIEDVCYKSTISLRLLTLKLEHQEYVLAYQI
jgi:hypothetical protein